MACASSLLGAADAFGMMSLNTDLHRTLVGGVETMSYFPLALERTSAEELSSTLRAASRGEVSPPETIGIQQISLPAKGWVNKTTGRSMGEHMEETAQSIGIAREHQDVLALASHTNAAKAQNEGFFADVIVPSILGPRDGSVRQDTSLEKLSALRPVFDTSGRGTITAGNASPLTDGAASVWVVDDVGAGELPAGTPLARIVGFEFSAVDFVREGMLMAPAVGIPRLLARLSLTFQDIDVWEIHEAFAAQVLANVEAISDPQFVRQKAGVGDDLGTFPWDRVNTHGGSLAIGHPFGATGARILSQAAKRLAPLPSGSLALVSICADGGQAGIAVLERP